MKFRLSDKNAVLRFTKLTPERLAWAKKFTALSAVNRLARRAPVLTGRYRASFNVSVNGIDYSVAAPAPKEFVKEKRVFYEFDKTKAERPSEAWCFKCPTTSLSRTRCPMRNPSKTAIAAKPRKVFSARLYRKSRKTSRSSHLSQNAKTEI